MTKGRCDISTLQFDHTYVLDTSVLAFNPDAVETFFDNNVVIPIVVLEELDKMKKAVDGIGVSARQALRNLDVYRKAGSLRTGVPTQSGGIVRIGCMRNAHFSELPMGLERSADNYIILTAYLLQNDRRAGKYPRRKHDVVVVSKDVNLRIKADACGLRAEDYRGDNQITNIRDLYSGVTEMIMGKNFEPSVLFKGGVVSEEDLASYVEGEVPTLYPNEGCVLRYIQLDKGVEKQRRVLTVYNKAERIFRHVKPPQNSDCENDTPEHVCVGPRNDRQALALEHLMNPCVPVVSLIGKAGTGKTLLALLAAVRQLEAGIYDQILVYRPNIEMGKQLGFLPGDLNDKFEPWKIPIFDNLPLVLSTRKGREDKDKSAAIMKRMVDSERLVIEPINFIRGRTFHNKFILVDETQNLTPLEVKTIVTRMGKNSKLVLAGDPAQIDNPIVDAISNGLTRTAQKLRIRDLFAHVTLTKSERSMVAEVASELL